MSSRLIFIKCKHIRLYSTKQNMKVIEDVDELLLNDQLKHRQHPGVSNPKLVEQPSWLLDSIKELVKDKNISLKQLQMCAKRLSSYLHERQLPKEADEIELKLYEIKSQVEASNMDNIENTINTKVTNTKLLKNLEVSKRLKGFTDSWKPINYDMFTSLVYVVSRSVPEYSVVYKIFNEINTRDKNFVPKTLFDFGSGIGTVSWAASKFWNKSIKEYFCVDISSDMNKCSEYLMKKAIPQINTNYVFYRQFFPASPIPTYDIVISAYSLSELPNQKCRLEAILKLWNKTNCYLVIIEQGTKYGFKIINEAREFILKYGRKRKYNAYAFSPCPHDLHCPVYMSDDRIPCTFEIKYLTLPLVQKSSYKREIYSYVILKKDKRSEDDDQWPRIIRPTLKRSKHVICRMCTASGKFEEQIFTTWKNGKNTYRCARSSHWGDRLPFKFEEIKEKEEPEELRGSEESEEFEEMKEKEESEELKGSEELEEFEEMKEKEESEELKGSEESEEFK